MFIKTKLKIQQLITWLKQNKLFNLPVLIFILILIPLTLILFKRGIHITPQAEVDDVDLYFNPSDAQIPGGEQKTFHIMLNVRTNQPPFMRVAFTFDKNKINLTNEIITTSLMTDVIEKTSMADANSTGRAVIVLAVPPDQSLPTGIMEFANFTIKSTILSGKNDNTSINFDSQDIQIVDTTQEQTNVTTANASLIINYIAPTPTPTSPTPTSSPITPTPTLAQPTPTSTPYPTPTPTPTPTPSAVDPGTCYCRSYIVRTNNCNTGYSPMCVKNNECECQ